MNKPVTLPDTSTAPEASALRGLFEPFEVKSLSLRNRFAMAPMTRAFSPDGIPGADVAEYYRRRAAGGVGLIITEGTYIPDPAAGPHTRVPRIYGDSSLGGWKSVVDAVHAEGGSIIPQLWHLGVERGENSRLNPEVETVSPSGLALDGTRLGREFTTSDLDDLKQSWVDAALNAKNTGFDGLELHGAHGYLLDEFLWAGTNVRTDGYGGSLEAIVSRPRSSPQSERPSGTSSRSSTDSRSGSPAITTLVSPRARQNSAASSLPWSTPASTFCIRPRGVIGNRHSLNSTVKTAHSASPVGRRS